MLLLWLTGYLALLPGTGLVDGPRIGVFLVFLSLALIRARRIARILILLALGGALLSSGGSSLSILLAAAEFSMIFTLFLPTLVLVRETMDRTPEVQIAQARFSNLAAEDRLAGLTGAVHALGAFLIIGALFMTGPFVLAQADRRRRRQEALAAMRGFGLAVWWSPFTIGMAFALTNRPEVPLVQAMALGFLLAMIGLAVSLLAFTPGAAFEGLRNGLGALRPIAPAAGLSILGVVLLASISPVGTVAAVGLVMPLLCFARLHALGGGQVVSGVQTTIRLLHRLGDEFLLFTAAAIFGFTLQETGGAALLAGWLAFDRLPSMLVPLAIMALGIMLALVGVHSVVIGGLVVALLHPIAGRIPDLIEVATILIPWGAAAMISYASLSVVTAVTVYRLAFMDFIWSRNLGFLVVMSLMSALVMVPLFWWG